MPSVFRKTFPGSGDMFGGAGFLLFRVPLFRILYGCFSKFSRSFCIAGSANVPQQKLFHKFCRLDEFAAEWRQSENNNSREAGDGSPHL